MVSLFGQVDYAYWPLNVGPKPGCGGDENLGLRLESSGVGLIDQSNLDYFRSINLDSRCLFIHVYSLILLMMGEFRKFHKIENDIYIYIV